MEIEQRPDMSYHLEPRDLLDLWRYSEDRAERTKHAMFQTMTWLLGFTGALLALLLNQVVEPPDRTATDALLGVVVTGGAGLALCWYSRALLTDFVHHIRRNWSTALRIRERIEGLDILVAKAGSQGAGTGTTATVKASDDDPQPWAPIAAVIRAFAAALVILIVVSAVRFFVR